MSQPSTLAPVVITYGTHTLTVTHVVRDANRSIVGNHPLHEVHGMRADGSTCWLFARDEQLAEWGLSATDDDMPATRDAASEIMFDLGTTVRTTVHSIGGRSEEVSGTVYEVKRSRKDGRVVCLYVETDTHGQLAVSPADARLG